MCCFARLRWHSRSLLWYAIALIDVAIGEVGPCNERLPLWVARSTSGLRPCWGCFLAELSTNASSLWIVFELTNDARTRKIRAGFDLRHDVRDIYTYIYREREIPQQTRLCGARSGSPQSMCWSLCSSSLNGLYIHSCAIIDFVTRWLFWASCTLSMQTFPTPLRKQIKTKNKTKTNKQTNKQTNKKQKRS